MMDEQDVAYEEKLQAVWGTIKKEVKLSEIADSLIENGVLKIQQWEELKSIQNVPERDRIESFLFMLIKQKSPKNFDAFIEALKSNGHDNVAQKLQRKGTVSERDTSAQSPHITLHHDHSSNQTKTEKISTSDEASGYANSETTNVMEMIQLMYKQMNIVISKQQTAEEQMGTLLKNDEAMKDQIGKFETDMKAKIETYQKDNQKNYELLETKYKTLLKELDKKEEDLKNLKIQLQNLEEDQGALDTEKLNTFQLKLTAMLKTTAERAKRLQDLNNEIHKFLQKFAEAFDIPNLEENGSIVNYFDQIFEIIKSWKIDDGFLIENVNSLMEENTILMNKNRILEEEISKMGIKKRKIEERFEKRKMIEKDKTSSNLKIEGKKCYSSLYK